MGPVFFCSARHAAPIAAIEKQCFSEPWSEKALDGFFSFEYNGALGIEEDGTFAGYITYTVSIDEVQIANVAVSPALRRRGIAKALIAALTDYANSKQYAVMTLEVRASNEPARRLYEAAGFQICGLRRGYYSHPKEDAVIMTLTLGTPKGTDNP